MGVSVLVKSIFYNSYGDLLDRENTSYPEQQLARCDLNKDGKISADEFQVFLTFYCIKHLHPTPQPSEHCKKHQ